VEWQKKRTASVEGLKFPYEYREGQKELMENVYKTIYHKKKLFIQAPTGVGKTLATLYPTILSGNKGMCDKLFYLTAKTVTGSVAVNAFDILRNKGLTFKSIQITAKEKVCANETCDCNPVACPYAKGHFDRVNEALYDLLIHEEDLRRETIAEYAEKHRVCPFELSLDASLFADGIICDYNYLFDPHVYLKRFFADGNTQNNYVFLIDEAHNLLERGREMYSATLVKENFLLVKRILKSGPLPLENRFIKRINKWLDKCNSELLKLKKLMDERSIGVEINALVAALQNL
jgi:Rad3-related DNA helicase